MPFSLGKNQNRTIWSENKIWWRNYCKVRFHCFLPISFFKVSLVVGFLFVCFVSFLVSICWRQKGWKRFRSPNFLGMHCHTLASYRKIRSHLSLFHPIPWLWHDSHHSPSYKPNYTEWHFWQAFAFLCVCVRTCR